MVAKLILREGLLVLLTGLAAALLAPWLAGAAAPAGAFYLGLMLGLNYMVVYALVAMIAARMPAFWREWLGLLGWVAAFTGEIAFFAGLVRAGLVFEPAAVYVQLAPAALALPVVLAAILKAPAGSRISTAAVGLLLYSASLLIVRDFLVGLLLGPVPMAVTAVQLGALYLAVRVVLRLLMPLPGEGDPAAPLVRRTVPDGIAALVERAAKRRAQPWATLPDGKTDEQVLSILVHPEEAEQVRTRVEAALEGRPFTVARGDQVAEQVELVVRPRRDPR